MFDWLIGQGGLKEIEKINFQKSKLVYDTIDSSDFYTTHVDIRFRSRINIPFFLPSEDLVDGFVEGAKEQNLINLRGHKAVGGLRANLYNSMPIEGVEALVDWLIEYEKKNG